LKLTFAVCGTNADHAAEQLLLTLKRRGEEADPPRIRLLGMFKPSPQRA
jgi:hypothetical protein